jgi:hypothetical protein
MFTLPRKGAAEAVPFQITLMKSVRPEKENGADIAAPIQTP